MKEMMENINREYNKSFVKSTLKLKNVQYKKCERKRRKNTLDKSKDSDRESEC